MSRLESNAVHFTAHLGVNATHLSPAHFSTTIQLASLDLSESTQSSPGQTSSPLGITPVHTDSCHFSNSKQPNSHHYTAHHQRPDYPPSWSQEIIVTSRSPIPHHQTRSHQGLSAGTHSGQFSSDSR